MITSSKEVKKYFNLLNEEVKRALKIAQEARKKGLDPENEVEVKIANDLGERVEGLLGIKGIKDLLSKLEKEGKKREEIAFELTKKIARGEIIEGEKEKLIEIAVRVGIAILTEGVLVAPTEGISKIKVKENYISAYYAGPIRSAGGTVAALSVLLADLARRENKIGRFKPTKDEVERYLEEINLYDARAARLQYKPPEEHIRTIVENCPICIDGDPTEEIEVSVNRNLPRVETNRVRGGIALVICEGIAQKAQKLKKYISKLGIDGWEWIDKIIKIKKTEEKVEIKEDYNYLDGVVAGRPIFSYPSSIGGFRIRYGRARTNSLMAKGIHPALMIITDNFLANGTHIKIERPGKGAVVSSVDGIEGPIVKLKNGDVIKIESIETAKKVKENIEEILFLGDILVTYGDFLKTNTPLLPSPYVEEWWEKEAKEKGIATPKNVEEAFKISREYSLPLYPKYLFFWSTITKSQLLDLFRWLKKASEIKKERIAVDNSPTKRVLELIGVPHKVREGKVIIEGENAIAIAKTLNLKLSEEEFEKILKEEENVLNALSKASSVKIEDKAPKFCFIGARMGRPEKAKERKMNPPVHVLFPTGDNKIRELNKMYSLLKQNNKPLKVEIANYYCFNCKGPALYKKCYKCYKEAKLLNICQVCGKVGEATHCSKPTKQYGEKSIDFIPLFEKIKKELGVNGEVKGVKGLTSKTKTPERMEKGFLRKKHEVFVFRDGTIRFDASNVPLTHFYPKEIGVSVEKLKELGYDKDWKGKELEKEDQLVPLKVQDIVISEEAANYLFRVSKFIDDLLVNVYGLPPFYSLSSKKDLIGHLVIALAPHISTGIVARIIGISKANVFYAHPFLHAAKRRNCDGDEDSIMLILDAFINFSKHYLSESRGGTMDSPLILTLNLNPKEIDDEAYCIEIEEYNIDFYKKSRKFALPGEVKIKTVGEVIGREEQFDQLKITHSSSCIDCGNNTTTYKKLKSIPEKLEREIKLMKKIRAVNLKDAIEKIIINHFIPDIYGNLRRFSRQKFRCVNCQEKYRRVPLKGVCTKCGGNLTLTIHKGGIEKYLDTTIKLAEEFRLSDYLRQRLYMVKEEIKSLFEDEKSKQFNITEYFS